jgi:solute:Na+ symporter, SSS family
MLHDDVTAVKLAEHGTLNAGLTENTSTQLRQRRTTESLLQDQRESHRLDLQDRRSECTLQDWLVVRANDDSTHIPNETDGTDAMETQLATIDYVLLALYLAGTLALGLMIGRKMKTGRDYFLGSRQLPWWAIGMSLVATDIGATDIIGVGGAAYSYGLAVGNFEWIGCVPAMIVAAFVFIPFFWRIGVYTIPEYLERRYNPAVRSALATCWLLFMACNLGVMLMASAKMMAALVGWDETVCILLTAAMVGIYTFAGGLAAVVYTDMIQCAVMVAGCLLVLVIGLIDVGGVNALMSELRRVEQNQRQEAEDSGAESQAIDSADDDQAESTASIDHTSLLLPVETKSPFPWTAILFGLAFILSPAYWIGNQAIVQRSLGAKSEYDAKAAYIWGALLKNVIPFVIAVPGLVALVKFPELADGDKAFPSLVSAMLPAGLRGIFLASFIAALMSSIDSYLNSASAIVTNDVYKRFVRPQATDQHLLWVGRSVTIFLVLWAILFSQYLMGIGEGLYTIFQTLMSFFQGPAFAVLMAGLLWRRATGVGAFIGFVSGVLFAITLFALSQETVYTALNLEPLFQIEEAFLYFSIWAFVVALIVTVAVSLITRPESEEKQAYVVYGGHGEIKR